MVTQTLASTIVMGLLVAAIVVAASRYATAPDRARADERPSPAERLSASLDSPAFLGGIFAVLAVIVALVTVASVGAFGIPGSIATVFFGGTVAVIGLLIATFLFLGPYVVTRNHGLGNAHATAAGIITIGLALLAVIAAQLLVGA